MRREYRFSGFGGQGVLTVGKIFGQAAAVNGGYFCVQTQSYGPESRGGTSRSEVIVADREINNPIIINTHVLVVMSQQAFDKYHEAVHSGGLVLYDSTLVKPGRMQEEKAKSKKIRLVGVPASQTAQDEGALITANIVLLGALTGLEESVKMDDVKASVLANVPPKTRSLNEKVFEMGAGLVG